MLLFYYVLKCYISLDIDSLIFPLMVADILLHFSNHFLIYAVESKSIFFNSLHFCNH